MKIAYVVGYVPNLIRTRPYNLIKQLVALGQEVTVFTLGSGAQDRKDAKSLRSRVANLYYQEQPVWYSLWNCLKVVPSRTALQTVYSWNPRLAKHLVDLLSIPGTFDIVHTEHLRASLYGHYVKSKLPHIPVVWDSVDCISDLYEQAVTHSTGGFGKYVTRFELGRTRWMERRLLGAVDRIVITTERDKEALLTLVPPGVKPAPVSILSNGVDLEFFHPDPDAQRETDTLVFSGKMSFHANVSMVKFLVAEIMPKVWARRPKVRLMIVGKDPTTDVRALGADSRIMVTGMVEDIRPYLWKATIAAVPLVYGAGIQNKILEAMACGTPVITTSKALSSLNVIPGKELLVGDGPGEFAQRILDLLNDQGLQKKIGSAGDEYVRKNHNWTVIANRLLACYTDTINDIGIKPK